GDEFVPVAGNRNRRLEQAAPRQPRVRLMRRLEPGDRTRHGARGAPDPKDLRGAAVELDVDQIHLADGALDSVAGNRDEEIMQTHLPGRRRPDELEAASTRAGQR